MFGLDMFYFAQIHRCYVGHIGWAKQYIYIYIYGNFHWKIFHETHFTLLLNWLFLFQNILSIQMYVT